MNNLIKRIDSELKNFMDNVEAVDDCISDISLYLREARSKGLNVGSLSICIDGGSEHADYVDYSKDRITSAFPGIDFTFIDRLGSESSTGNALHKAVQNMADEHGGDPSDILNITVADTAVPYNVDPKDFIEELLNVFVNATVQYLGRSYGNSEKTAEETAEERIERKLLELQERFGDKGPETLHLTSTRDKTPEYIGDLAVAINSKYPNTKIFVGGCMVTD